MNDQNPTPPALPLKENHSTEPVLNQKATLSEIFE